MPRCGIAVALEFVDADLVGVGLAVAVCVALVFEVKRAGGLMRAAEVGLLLFVAGRDQPFELQPLEIVGEVVEEVADARVVAIAKDGLALEVGGVVLEFLLDVGKLGVKLVLLGRLGGVQTAIQGLASCPRVSLLGHASMIPSENADA